MRLTNIAGQFRVVKKLAFYTSLCAVLIFQGCSREWNNVTQFGSHKITVARHAMSHGAYIEEPGDNIAPSFHYTGFSLSGKYQVVIVNEEVTVNGKVYSRLNKGDSVNITDSGVTVNSLDYGETAQYLQTNSEQARR